MRVLITGSGVHCCQFVEALMFHKEYELIVFSQQNNSLTDRIRAYGILVSNADLPALAADADIIILADLPEERLCVINLLKGAANNALFLVDKPSSLSVSDEKELQDFLKDKKHLFAYSRFFEKNKIIEELKSIPNRKTVNVYWPNFFELGIQMVRDTLPHVLELLLILSPDWTQERVNWSYDYTDKNMLLHFSDGEKEYNFTVFNTTDREQKVTLNDVQLEWLNYFHYIPTMLKCLVGQDLELFNDNHNFNTLINQYFFTISERKD